MASPSAGRYCYARPQAIAIALLLVALSGCLDEPSPDQLPSIPPTTPAPKADEQLDPAIIASGGWDRALGLTVPVCADNAAPWKLMRDRKVPENSTRMEASYETDGFFGIGEGFELGYVYLGVSIDEGPFTWYNMSAAPDGKLDWPILESQQEPDGFRWQFAIRNTLYEDDECTTSGGSGEASITIRALHE